MCSIIRNVSFSRQEHCLLHDKTRDSFETLYYEGMGAIQRKGSGPCTYLKTLLKSLSVSVRTICVHIPLAYMAPIMHLLEQRIGSNSSFTSKHIPPGMFGSQNQIGAKANAQAPFTQLQPSILV